MVLTVLCELKRFLLRARVLVYLACLLNTGRRGGGLGAYVFFFTFFLNFNLIF